MAQGRFSAVALRSQVVKPVVARDVSTATVAIKTAAARSSVESAILDK
jgi:hypothetical protein